MYGISNSQQQGGGGGGAASYKAIKATLTPSDWQEVAGATPYFVGDDATTWAKDSETQQPIKTSNSDLGIIAGQQYTITITANGVTYSSTATAESRYGMLMLVFTFSETANAMVMIYDHVDWAAGNPGNGSATMVNTGQNTSLVITNFAGEGFGTTIQATIADSAIKTNSAVTMYTNTSEKIAVGEKTNGTVTLIAPSVPETAISYSLEIVGTDTEGLFELINGYIPPTIEVPTALPQKTSAIKTGTLPKGESRVEITDSEITATSDVVVDVSYKKKVTGGLAPGMLALVLSNGEEADEDISFEYKIKQTDGTGQFIVVNSYIPSVSDAVLLKTITNTSTNVSITGSASPYLFTVTDSDVTAGKFIRLYPNDADTETWLNTHTVSSIITESSGSFTFNVDTATLPSAFSIKYIIESPQ